MAVDQLPDNEAAPGSRAGRGPILAAILNPFGRFGIRLNNTLGAMAIFLCRAFIRIFHYKQIPEIINQIYFIGAKSASIVALVGFFTGMVLGLQLYYVMNKFGAVGFLGTAVSLSLIVHPRNPYAPTGMALKLLPTMTIQTLRRIHHASDLHEIVHEFAGILVKIREERTAPWRL